MEIRAGGEEWARSCQVRAREGNGTQGAGIQAVWSKGKADGDSCVPGALI